MILWTEGIKFTKGHWSLLLNVIVFFFINFLNELLDNSSIDKSFPMVMKHLQLYNNKDEGEVIEKLINPSII